MRRRGTFAATSTVADWFRRFGFAALIAVSLLLVLTTRIVPTAGSSVRAWVQDVAAPVLTALSRPAETVRELNSDVRSYGELLEEVQLLRDENVKLKELESRFLELEAENTRLRDLARVVEDDPLNFISARVISDQGSTFNRTVLLNAGQEHGVRRGMAVMASTGLVGRVADIGRRTSRVLLINDITSRIPVIVERTGSPAVLVGDNSSSMELIYLAPDAQQAIRPGDRVVTSGSGGVFPFGLPAGQVIHADAGRVLANPVVDWESRLFMKIVDFNLKHFLPEDG